MRLTLDIIRYNCNGVKNSGFCWLRNNDYFLITYVEKKSISDIKWLKKWEYLNYYKIIKKYKKIFNLNQFN